MTLSFLQNQWQSCQDGTSHHVTSTHMTSTQSNENHCSLQTSLACPYHTNWEWRTEWRSYVPPPCLEFSPRSLRSREFPGLFTCSVPSHCLLISHGLIRTLKSLITSVVNYCLAVLYYVNCALWSPVSQGEKTCGWLFMHLCKSLSDICLGLRKKKNIPFYF